MGSDFSPKKIAKVRSVQFQLISQYLDASIKQDVHYEPLDPARQSYRLQIAYSHQNFQLVIAGEKFVNDLVPFESNNRGGGGSIDFLQHLTRQSFVETVKTYLDAAEQKGTRL